MAMFDPQYVTEVLNDILGRRGLEVKMVLKDKPEPPHKGMVDDLLLDVKDSA